MAKIKLISGMDFSGKTTIIKGIDEAMPGIFKIQKKFLTPIDVIEKVRKNDKWLSPEEWKPLLENAVRKDIADYRENGLVLQDSLWIVKYMATKIEKDDPEDYEEIRILNKLLEQYPDMDSFYLTATTDERIKRLNIRENSGKEITKSDKLLFSREKFEEIEKNYQKIILNRFPNTRIIDTTGYTPKEIVDFIMKDENFLKNIKNN